MRRAMVFMGVAYGPYSLAYRTAVITAGGSVTDAEMAALTVFETGNTNLAELDRLWIHGMQNQIAARISFVNPSSTAITEVNSPTWTSGLGYSGNGSSMYLNSNYNFSSSSVKYTRNSGCAFAYIGGETNTTFLPLGAYNGTNVAAWPSLRKSITSVYWYINADGTIPKISSISTTKGLFSIVRTASNASAIYRNGSSVGTDTIASAALINNNCFLMAGNSAGTPAQFMPNIPLSISGIGSGSVNQSTFYTQIQALATSLGFSV